MFYNSGEVLSVQLKVIFAHSGKTTKTKHRDNDNNNGKDNPRDLRILKHCTKKN